MDAPYQYLTVALPAGVLFGGWYKIILFIIFTRCRRGCVYVYRIRTVRDIRGCKYRNVLTRTLNNNVRRWFRRVDRIRRRAFIDFTSNTRLCRWDIRNRYRFRIVVHLGGGGSG